MKKDYFSISGFLATMLLSCGVVGAAESVMVASTETEATAEATAKAETEAAQKAAEQVGEIQYVEYESRLEFGGHIYGSWQDGFYMNSPNRTNINQIWLSAERAMDTSNGADWGFCVDATFGTESAQCYGDGGFDGKWGESGDGYCTSIYQAYAEVGYYNMSMKVGKFGTLIGYESYDTTEMLFNTHSYMYEYEPQTHCGALLTWDVSDKFAVNFGVTTGADNSFENSTEDYGLIFGASYQITDSLSVGYAGMWNKVHGYDRAPSSSYAYFDLFEGYGTSKKDEYQQTLSLSWDITCRLNYTIVFNYASMTFDDADDAAYSHVGLGNYLTYTLTDKITLGARYEWFKQDIEDGNMGYESSFDEATYHAVSLAAKYMPTEHVFIRPEVRYDWVEEGEKEDGVTGSFGFGLVF